MTNGHYQLVRVDADGGKVTGRVRLGSDEPQTIVPIGKQVWVITGGGRRDPRQPGVMRPLS
jgi:hypothetical protein